MLRSSMCLLRMIEMTFAGEVTLTSCIRALVGTFSCCKYASEIADSISDVLRPEQLWACQKWKND